MLDWSGEIVADGRWDSSDPNVMVHNIPLGDKFMRVWVDVAKSPNAYLFRPSRDVLTIREAVGTTVAWPAEKVILRGEFSLFVIYEIFNTSYFKKKIF